MKNEKLNNIKLLRHMGRIVIKKIRRQSVGNDFDPCNFTA